MANLHNTDFQTHIGDRIDDPIRSLADAKFFIVAGEFFTTGRPRIGREERIRMRVYRSREEARADGFDYIEVFTTGFAGTATSVR